MRGVKSTKQPDVESRPLRTGDDYGPGDGDFCWGFADFRIELAGAGDLSLLADAFRGAVRRPTGAERSLSAASGRQSSRRAQNIYREWLPLRP
jgi:hypothetical protein